MLLVEKVPKLLGTGFVPTTKRFEGLGLGVEREQNSWLHLAGLWFAFPMNNRQLVDPRPNLTRSVSVVDNLHTAHKRVAYFFGARSVP